MLCQPQRKRQSDNDSSLYFRTGALKMKITKFENKVDPNEAAPNMPTLNLQYLPLVFEFTIWNSQENQFLNFAEVNFVSACGALWVTENIQTLQPFLY